MVALGISILLLNVSFSSLYAQNFPFVYIPIVVTGCISIAGPFFAYFFFGEIVSIRFLVGVVLIVSGMIVMVK